MKRYEVYKQSGLVDVGNIPEHWEIVNFRYLIDVLTDFTANGSFGDLAKNVNYLDIGYSRLIRLTDLRACFQNVGIYLNEHSHNYLSKSELFGDEVLLANVGAYAGLAWVFKDFEGIASLGPNMFLLRFNERLDNSYAYVSLISDYLHNQLINKATSSAQPKLNKDDVRSCYFVLPPLNEQTTIASFLDHKTEQIDLIIKKKEELIEKLKEQRQSIINESVTKGLNPNAKMKDSGIEWLGEIPEHWEGTSLKYLGICQNGVSQGAEYFGSGFPFVSYGDVYKNEELPRNVKGLAKSTIEDQKRFSVEKGDVFFTRTSETIQEIGLASICMKTIEYSTFAGFLIRFRPYSNMLCENFSKYYFRSFVPRVFFVREMNLVTRASLSQELLKRLPVFLPSMDEQKKIANYLDDRTTLIDDLLMKIDDNIANLKEYRKSLIFEAVTGKIDVRGFDSSDQK